MNLRSVSDVIINGLWEGIGLLEDHADFLTKLHYIETFVIDVFVIQGDFSSNPATFNNIIHPVDASQKS